MLKTLLGTQLLIPCSFLFQMGYLIHGYYATEANYITWVSFRNIVHIYLYGLHKICNEEIIILRLPTLFIIVTIPFTFRVNCFTTLGFFCYVTQHIISQGAVAVVFIFIHGRIQLQKGATFHT